jgi:RNA polymerase-binding protein DksA
MLGMLGNGLTKKPTYGNVRRLKPDVHSKDRDFTNLKSKVCLRGEDMEQAFINRMEKSLSDLKSEIISNLLVNNEDFKEIVEGMDPKDLADIASDDIDRKMIEAIGSQEMKRLRLIDSALTRIQQGKYGLCIKCGKRIPQDRLEAIPYALMCIDCKTAEERRNR